MILGIPESCLEIGKINDIIESSKQVDINLNDSFLKELRPCASYGLKIRSGYIGWVSSHREKIILSTEFVMLHWPLTEDKRQDGHLVG